MAISSSLWSVILVLAVILGGLFMFLIYLDFKMNKREKKHRNQRKDRS